MIHNSTGTSSCIIQGDCSGDTSSFSGPYVSIGCVVFPVFVLVWLRYSKQYCHSLGNGDGCGEMDFQKMPDDGEAFETGSTTQILADRLVKWINRRNVFSTGSEPHADARPANPAGADPDLGGDCFCDDFESRDGEGEPNLFWECIPNTPQTALVELCSTTKTNRSLERQNYNDTTFPSDSDSEGVAHPMVVPSESADNSIAVITASVRRR